MTPPRLLYRLKFKVNCSCRGLVGGQKPHPLGKDPETSRFVEGQVTGVASSCSPQSEPLRKSSLRLQAERVESAGHILCSGTRALQLWSGQRSSRTACEAQRSRGRRKDGWAWPRAGGVAAGNRQCTRNAGAAVSGRRAAFDFLTVLLWEVGLPWLLPPN